MDADSLYERPASPFALTGLHDPLLPEWRATGRLRFIHDKASERAVLCGLPASKLITPGITHGNSRDARTFKSRAGG